MTPVLEYRIFRGNDDILALKLRTMRQESLSSIIVIPRATAEMLSSTGDVSLSGPTLTP
jgi:hypothetical protein